MLRENPRDRPNIYSVLKEACAMQGREPPVKDVSPQFALDKVRRSNLNFGIDLFQAAEKRVPSEGAVFFRPKGKDSARGWSGLRSAGG